MLRLLLARGAKQTSRTGAALHSSTSSQLVDAAATQPLFRWLTSSGADVSGVSINVDVVGNSGWGLAAVRDTAEGDLLVALPHSCTLSYDTATLAPSLRRLLDQVPAELWAARLGLVVLDHRAKGSDSLYAPYVSLLPSRFDGVPIFFSREAVDALQYPPVSEQVKRRSRFLLSFARGALASDTDALAFGGARVDADAMGWALSAVSSRAFRLRGPTEAASMLPLIDLCNHSFEPNAEVKTMGGKQAVALVAKQRIAAGTPVLISYGPLSNDFLLLDYGFVGRNNPHDTCALRFSSGLLEIAREVAGLGHIPLGRVDENMNQGDAIAAAPWQQLILADLGLVGAHANLEVLIGGEGAIDSRLLAALRVLFLQDEAHLRDIPEQQRAAALRVRDAAGIVPAQVERCALATAAAICAVTLSQWRTTLAQDDALLASQEAAAMPADVRLAITFRAEKKRCLSKALTTLKVRMGV